MALIQIILLILAGWLLMKLLVRGYAIFKIVQNFINLTKAARNNFKNKYNSNTQKSKDKKKNGHMVECAKCNIYIPENESYFSKEKYYCCKEHSL